MFVNTTTGRYINCYHCGEKCPNEKIYSGEKKFCCEGCKMVYNILNQNELCDYYNLNENPGINQLISVRKDRFSFLDDKKIQDQLISFRNENHLHVTFYLPQMHCSSCLYLLENLHKLDEGVVSCKVNFIRLLFYRTYSYKRTIIKNIFILPLLTFN